MRNPKFSVFKSEKKCLFYYRDLQGKIIIMEDGFVSRHHCLLIIDQIKAYAPLETSYNRLDQFRAYSFYFKSAEGHLIAGSIVFTSKALREQAIRELQKHAATAPVVDLSSVGSQIK